MNTTSISFVSRKIIASFVTAILLAMVMSLFNLDLALYEQGNHFVGWTFVIFLYAGAIILVYGNIISIGVELLQRKYLSHRKWIYVTILGLFGALAGIFLNEMLFAIVGFCSAVFYSLIDLYLMKYSHKTKALFILILSPLFILFGLWLCLQIMSPSLPPFTKEAAVTFATSGEGTHTSKFPKEIGIWTGTIGDYAVKRETSVTSNGNEKYIVIFKEEWRKGYVSGSSLTSYLVDRNSMTLYNLEGDSPPYYAENPNR